MKRLFICLLCSLSIVANVSAQKVSELKYTDAKELTIINKGFDNTELLYSRLPEDMKSVTRKAVWDLGLNSAGVAIRFSSNSKAIGVKWELLNNFNMSHMAATGVRGIDLYVLVNGEWFFVGTAKPNGKQSSNMLISRMAGEEREYMAYLPLYDGVTKVEIGCDSSAFIAKPKNGILVPNVKKPLLFYGTSITQGGCASRPGMTYASIISRKLQQETINLGFSGNARMDKSMAEIIARIDAEKYVLDCLPNCTTQILKDSAYYFITYLAKAKPQTPIYMVENVIFPPSIADIQSAKELKEKNAYWEELYKKLRKEGYKNIKYIPAKGLIGNDGECTVDGAHMTDLGFMRMAEGILKRL